MAPKPGKHIGPWLLGEELGHGGNAWVFAATSEQFVEPVALKVLKARKPQSESYQRFVREVTFLEKLGDFPGVLPVLQSHLSEENRRQEHPWLAMPVAGRLDVVLEDASLDTVVEAVRTVAATLARLAEEHELAHRDLKPANLYELDKHWLVGDFGLVEVPDVDELTRSGQKLGPANFTAYEMILDASRADPRPADVYSLGKTLWALATGVRWPPNGHQPAESPGYNIRDQRPHARAAVLDRLVDAMTLLDPAERPSMAQIATDLGQWSQLADDPVEFDVTDMRLRIREALASELETQDRQEREREQAVMGARRLQEHVRPLDAGLREIHPGADIAGQGDRLTENRLKTIDAMGEPEIVWSWIRCSRLASGPEYSQYVLRMGRGLELREDGRLILRTLLDVGLDGVGGSDFWWESDERSAPVGTVEQERMLEEGVEELQNKLHEALAAFAESVARQAG